MKNENFENLQNDFKKFQKEVTEKSREIWLAGLGVVSEAEGKGQELFKGMDSKRGDLQKKGEDLEKKLIAFGNERKEEINKSFKDSNSFLGRQFQKMMDSFGMAPKTDVNELNAKVEELSKTLEELTAQLEAKKAAPAKTTRKRTTKTTKTSKDA